MTVSDLCRHLGLTVQAGEEGLSRPVTGCYIGDLLSWVMGRAPEACAWLTVMGHVNAVAVAQLADVGCMILCESAPLDPEAKNQADQHGIPVLSSPEPAFALALRLAELLGEF